MEHPGDLSQAQQAALAKLSALLGAEHIDLLISQGPEVLTARINAFMQYEAAIILAGPRPVIVGFAYALRAYGKKKNFVFVHSL